MTTLYESDFVAWIEEQAQLARKGRSELLDLPHLADEIEEMGRSEKREALSRLVILLVHLLKWDHQPQLRSRSWEATIAIQRRELADLFERSPSLRGFAEESQAKVYAKAIANAALETGYTTDMFPAACPYPFEQILNG